MMLRLSLYHFRHCLFLLLACATLLVKAPPAEAALVNLISIDEVNSLSFGSLLLPPSGTDSVTVSASSGAISGSGDVVLSGSSSAARGAYRISGLSVGRGQTVTIDIQNINTGNSNLQLDKFTGVYGSQSISNFPEDNLKAPALTGTMLYLGARLRYNNSLSAKTYTMTFDLVVNYE